jgi:hypothetical protein
MQEPMYMRDWLKTLDKFSNDFGIGVLEGGGSISHSKARKKAIHEYEEYLAALPDDLSDVEKAYLDALKDMRKKLDKAKNKS